ncbi:hypothetical protein CFC21_046049 [Triticum aestivum]|uniref:galactinol--sucrose galactosyltransferase n=2 Tax=Triticum aestivum TaxID=4565 RepID=A0A9R1FTU5_WHEAT|nr:hypothetical protein CFC21_046049 [Triticum aestivum]
MAPNLSKATDDLLGDVAVDGLKQSPRFTLKGKDLAVDGHPALLDVPANIRLTPASVLVSAAEVAGATDGSFLGFDAPAPESRHVVPIGKLVDTRFMSIFRFKVWWTTHWVGTAGRDVENETQMMVLDRTADRPYLLLLPIVDGAFRASLQSGEDDHVALCLESGSSVVKGSVFRSAVYLHAGDDPFELAREAARVVRAHLGTFRLLEEKTPPPIVDKFGWCTWDAFYLKVHPEGVWEGVRGLAEGGCPPGLVLIDDGWQSICHDDDDPADGAEGMNRTAAGEQMPCRLIKFQENHKFRDYKGGLGLGGFVREMKAAFPTVEQVYVWHALCGYWGGLRPGTPGLPPTKVVAPKLSPGLKRTMEDLAVDKIVNNGVGLVDPEHARELYEGLHSHLQASGIDGVKVDVIHVTAGNAVRGVRRAGGAGQGLLPGADGVRAPALWRQRRDRQHGALQRLHAAWHGGGGAGPRRRRLLVHRPLRRPQRHLLAAGLPHGALRLQLPLDGQLHPPGLGHVPVHAPLRRLPRRLPRRLRRPRLR